jgi:virginiamycin A acetyltransferase
MPLPDPKTAFPFLLPDGGADPGFAHLACAIDHPNWTIGRFAYAYDFDPPADWAARLAPYLYPGAPERLTIGPFCQIAHGARFITASANHAMGGISTYPFGIFDPATRGAAAGARRPRDTLIGPDCWIGHGAILLPGARLGAGVIVGAGAVVSGEVPDYAVVAGNPARVVRMRFPPEEVALLLSVAWWNWDEARIRANAPLIAAGDPRALSEAP